MRQQGLVRVRWVVLVILGVICAWGCDEDAPADSPQDTSGTTLTDTTAAPDTNGTNTTDDTNDADDVITPQAPITLLAGDYGLVVDFGARTLLWERAAGEDKTLLALGVDGLQLGEVTQVEDRINYDPYPFKAEDNLRKPPLVGWRTIQNMRVEDGATATNATLVLDYGDGFGAQLALEVTAGGRVQANWTVTGKAAQVAYLRLRAGVDGEEGFYGLGEYFDSVDNRGHVRAMQIEVDGGLESGYNEAHVPVPFVVGTRGWGLFVESFYPGVFDVAAEDAAHLDVLFGVGAAAGEGLRFHLMAAEHPLDVTKGYYEVTGFPKLPARWALGPWIWRDENRDQAQVESDLQTIRDLDLATTGYWIDRPYATAENTFDFDANMFTDPQAMIDTAHSLGFRMALWHTPYLDESSPETAVLRDEANAGGFYPVTSGLPLNGWGRLIDLTDAAAFAWWKNLIRRYTEMGIEGFKLDYGEDVVPGLLASRNVWEFEDGSDERTMHARYQLFYHQPYAELMPEDGGFLLCRGGTYGSQKYGIIIWPGDLDANMAKHGETTTNRDGQTFVAVGGLPASLVAALSLGPSGFAFYGSDTGGYRHSPPDREVFTRWFQQTALSTVMQIGTSSSDVAWEGNAINGFDAQMLEDYRRFTRLHLRLFPYLWTYAEKLSEDGRPIMRALGLAFPELGEHPDDIYVLGDYLLVAPVVDYGARTKEVIFPAGGWLNWWTGERTQGGQTLTVDAPLDTLPLYLMEGGIVPLLRPTIDTLAPTTEPALVDSYATDAGVLYAVLALPAQAQEVSFTLYDGATLSHSRTGNTYTVSTTNGAEFSQGFWLEALGLETAPTSVTLAGLPLGEAAAVGDLEDGPGWFWDGMRLHIRLPSGASQVSVDL
jgi:alpha-D-xyloside xylohydrolase